MDIHNNSLHASIRRLALKTTASAILTLNAKVGIADSCPTYITSSSGLAGVICDFDTGSSVTVENGGSVGGINMDHYAPTLPSDIIINTGGEISSSTTGTGINILNTSALHGGISNNGVISTVNSGILIAHSNVEGGISNNGTITSSAGTGIKVASSSAIVGGILNRGTIIGAGVDPGIALIDNSTLTGDISNDGAIESSGGDNVIIRLTTINGGITNNGTMHSTTGNGISMINSAAITNNIMNNGSISGGNNGISLRSASSIAGSIINTGSINGGANGLSVDLSVQIGGSISNSGTISGNVTGISVATSANISGGIANSGTIRGDLYAINAYSNTLPNIDILGKSARIIGDVQASSTLVNITNGAIFTSEGNYNVNTFNILSNAQFNMANTITANAVNNSGVLAITDPLQTIIGDYTQNSGGIFQSGISSVTDYGQLAITGTADLSQSGEIYAYVNANSSLYNGAFLPNIISSNTLITPTNGFTVNDNSYIWKFIPSLNDANNGLNLTVAINPDVYNVCQGAYCQGAATAIIGQISAGNSTFGPYAALPTASALQTAISQATPELTNENIQVIQLITRSVLDIVPMWDTLRGKSAGDAMLYQPGKVWVKPYGASMTQNERSTVEGFNATAYGAVIGKDLQLIDDGLVGGAFAAGGDHMRGKSVLNGQSINSNAYQVMLYGTKRLPNQLYVAGQGLLGYELSSTNRNIPLYASTAKGSYNSWFTNWRAEAGWSTYAFSPNFVFTPEIDASYLFINQGNYLESGSPMSLSVASNTNSSLILGAYGNGAYHVATLHNQHDLTLTGYAGIAGDVINSQPQVISTFVTSGSTFSTFGVQFNDVVFRGGAGITLTNQTQPLIVELNYDVQVGNNAYSGIGAATIKYKS